MVCREVWPGLSMLSRGMWPLIQIQMNPPWERILCHSPSLLCSSPCPFCYSCWEKTVYYKYKIVPNEDQIIWYTPYKNTVPQKRNFTAWKLQSKALEDRNNQSLKGAVVETHCQNEAEVKIQMEFDDHMRCWFKMQTPSRQFWDRGRWKSGLSIVISDCGRWKSGPCLLGLQTGLDLSQNKAPFWDYLLDYQWWP